MPDGIFELFGKDFRNQVRLYQAPGPCDVRLAGCGIDGGVFFSIELAAGQFFRDQIMLVLRTAVNAETRNILTPCPATAPCGCFIAVQACKAASASCCGRAETIGLGRPPAVQVRSAGAAGISPGNRHRSQSLVQALRSRVRSLAGRIN